MSGFTEVFPRAVKYQIITKTLMVVLILPLYGVATRLLAADQGAITNATLAGFLLSWRGLLAFLITLGLFLLGFAIELGGYVAITARAYHGQPEAGYRSLLRLSLGQLRNLLTFGGILLGLYLAVVVPLSGVGTGLSFLQGIKLPNFIRAFIEQHEIYSWAYLGLIIIFVLLSALLVFTPHLIVLGNLRAGRAMRASARLVRNNPRVLFVDILAKLAVAVVLLFLAVALWWVFVSFLIYGFGTEHVVARTIFAALLYAQYVGGFLLFLIQVPFQMNVVTHAFYRAIRDDEELAHLGDEGLQMAPKTTRTVLDRLSSRWPWVAAVVAVAILPLAIFTAMLHTELFRPTQETEIVAHRAGGFGTPENSLTGLEDAMGLGVQWVEIDVQRTRDGHYALNHDDTFARAAREPRAAQELTLAEVQQLNIGFDGEVERMPQLRDFLEAAKGRVKVIVELKGATADEQMGDDVVALIRELDMTEQTMVMSLDYDLVSAIDAKYPDIQAGFAYFLSFGDISQLSGDYLIFEEGEATRTRLLLLTLTGRKSMVWTVNEPASVSKFVVSDVDAIITDVPEFVRFKLDEARDEPDTDLFMRLFIGVGI